MTKPYLVESFPDGYLVLGDSTDPVVQNKVLRLVQAKVPLLLCDPPYGNIVSEKWDMTKDDDATFCKWMLDWTRAWSDLLLLDGGAFYVWGGVGRPGFRPFFRYLHKVEVVDSFELAALITWRKKRAYGVQNNYLFVREELAYFCKGNAKKPLCFNVPLTNQLRGYKGYDEKYEAKSDFLRRTMVWDETEIFKGKWHPTQKPVSVMKVPIEVHTKSGEYVVDMFGGSCVTAFAAREVGRRFVCIEKNQEYFEKARDKLKNGEKALLFLTS
jgi:DNA modification methylase